MSSGSMVFYGVGMLISYLLGGYTSYMMMIYIAMGLSAVELVLMLWLRESPVYLLKSNLEEVRILDLIFC
jgi:hypothetical protein